MQIGHQRLDKIWPGQGNALSVSAACCSKGSGAQFNFCLFFAPFANSSTFLHLCQWLNLQQVCIMPLVFYTAEVFEINEWVPPIGFTSTSRSQRSLQVVTHVKSPLFTSIQFLPEFRSGRRCWRVWGPGGVGGLWRACSGGWVGVWGSVLRAGSTSVGLCLGRSSRRLPSHTGLSEHYTSGQQGISAC